MAQIILKKLSQIVEEQEEEFIILSPVEHQIPKPEVLVPQAKSNRNILKIFKKGKNNAKYLDEAVKISPAKARLDARITYAPRYFNY